MLIFQHQSVDDETLHLPVMDVRPNVEREVVAGFVEEVARHLVGVVPLGLVKFDLVCDGVVGREVPGRRACRRCKHFVSLTRPAEYLVQLVQRVRFRHVVNRAPRLGRPEVESQRGQEHLLAQVWGTIDMAGCSAARNDSSGGSIRLTS